MKLKLFFLAVGLSFMGCEGDEEAPKPTTLFTLTVDASFKTEASENWIIIHDENGTPITFESFETGDVKILQTLQDVEAQSIGVTLLKISDEYGKKRYTIDTYFQYQKGAQLVLSSYDTSIPGGTTFTGTFDVTVNSEHPLDQCALSNQYAMATSSHDELSFTANMQLSDLPSKYLLQASNTMGDIRYKMLENVKPGESYTFAFDELSEFDREIEFKFPESTGVFLYISGREPGQSIEPPSYLNHFHINSDPHTSIKGGYLNSLSKYVTEFNVHYPTYDFFYRNKGSIPEGIIEAHSPSGYALASKDIQNFVVTSTNSFNYTRSLFYFSESEAEVNWSVYSRTGNHKLNELPAQISASHPILSLRNFKHSLTLFYEESLPYEKAILPEWKKENYISSGIALH